MSVVSDDSEFIFRTYINRDKVFQGFAHLQALDMQMSGVQEVIHPSRAVMIRL